MARAISAKQAKVIASGQYRTFVKVEVLYASQWRDLTWLCNTDFLKGVEWSDDVENQVGSCTVTCARNINELSLAPLHERSKVNNLGGSYSPMLQANRLFRVKTQVQPIGAPKSDLDWVEVFKGRIDSVDASNEDLTFTGRDLGGVMQDTFIENPSFEYGTNSPSTPTALENVIAQVIIDNNDYFPSGSNLNLYVPVTPAFGIQPRFKQDKMSIFDAVQRLAQLVGWEVRQRYVDDPMEAPSGYFDFYEDPPAPGWYLVFRDPRTQTSPSWEFSKHQFTELNSQTSDLTSVRNSVSIVYTPQDDVNRATGVLSAASNFTNGQTVTTGTKTYTFVTGTLYSTNGDVAIGLDPTSGSPNTTRAIEISLENLAAAINLGPGAGTKYSTGTTANTFVTARAYGKNLLCTSVLGGTGGNTTATTTTSSATWTGATLAGGADVERTVEVADYASVALYGRRFAQFADSAKMIHSPAGAYDLAGRILADLAEPWLEKSVTMPHHPFIEVADLVRFGANDVTTTSAQDLAVVRVRHTISGDKSTTTLACRGKPSVGRARWLRRETRVKPGTKFDAPPPPTLVEVTPNPGGGVVLIDPTGGTINTLPPVGGTPVSDWEIHVSKTPAFTPGPTTRHKKVKNTRGVFPPPSKGDITGQTPGETLYCKAVPLDAEGREGEASDEVSFSVPRITSNWHDPGVNPGMVPINGNFEHLSATGLPEHWTVIQPFMSDVGNPNDFGDGESVWYGNDADKGNYLSFRSGDDGARGAVKSARFEVRRGLQSLNLYISARKSGTSNTENECLTLEVSGYAGANDADDDDLFTNRVYIDASAFGLCPTANTWYDLQFQLADLGWSSNLPNNCNFLQVRLYRGIPTADNFGGITWDVGDVYAQEAGFFVIEAWSVTADGVQAGTLTADTISGFPDITQPSWNAVTFENSFENFGSGWAECKFFKDSMGFIHVRGLAKRASAATNTTMFTLPAGYRPASGCMFACVGNGRFLRVDVGTDGAFKVQAADDANWNAFISLDGITFDTR
jgi:hypothetical protein